MISKIQNNAKLKKLHWKNPKADQMHSYILVIKSISKLLETEDINISVIMVLLFFNLTSV